MKTNSYHIPIAALLTLIFLRSLNSLYTIFNIGMMVIEMSIAITRRYPLYQFHFFLV